LNIAELGVESFNISVATSRGEVPFVSVWKKMFTYAKMEKEVSVKMCFMFQESYRN